MADEVGGTLERLFKHSRWQAEHHLVFGHPTTGEPLYRHGVLRRFKKALKTAGFDQRHVFHDLRHTFGTRMAAVGVPVRTLEEWMGHRDICHDAALRRLRPGRTRGRTRCRGVHAPQRRDSGGIRGGPVERRFRWMTS